MEGDSVHCIAGKQLHTQIAHPLLPTSPRVEQTCCSFPLSEPVSLSRGCTKRKQTKQQLKEINTICNFLSACKLQQWLESRMLKVFLLTEFHYSPTYLHAEDIPLVEFMYFVFTGMPGKSYRRRLRSLSLCLGDDDELMLNVLRCHLTY